MDSWTHEPGPCYPASVPSGRSVFAVIAGYLVFGLSAVLLFQIAGVDPHVDTRLGFKIFSVAYGVVFALGAGWLAARLAPGRPLFHAAIVSVIIAVAATGSLVGASGAKWSQLAALLLMTPAVLLGGRLAGR
jgi:hypothetical protein